MPLHDVLEANAAFYTAFAERDLTAMAALWDDREEVVCLHPGWPPLAGRRQVMESWRSILAGQALNIACRAPRAFVLSDDVALVICHEVMGLHSLIASNLFRRNGAGCWRMVHHQAGPTQTPLNPDAAIPEPASQMLN